MRRVRHDHYTQKDRDREFTAGVLGIGVWILVLCVIFR